MSTSLAPENNNQVPLTDGQDPASVSPPIQPTETPINGPNKAAIDEAALRVIQQQNERIQALNDELTRVRTAPPPVPEPTNEELNKQFYENPAGFMDRFAQKIDRRLQETVAPLQEQYQTFKRDTIVDGFVNQAKVDPRIAGKWNPQLEAYVRQQLANLPPAQVNEAAFINYAVNGIGLQTLGQLPGSTIPASNNPPAPPPPANLPRNAEVIPPHLRPTNTPPTPPAGPNGGKQYRELTEDEARLAREMRMTKEEYLDLLSLNKSQVVDSTIGQRRQS